MPTNLRAAAFLLALSLSSTPAAAQERPGWVDADPFSSGDERDPLAVDRTDRLEAVTPTRAEDEVAPSVPVREGEALRAIAGVHETAHDVTVRLEGGLAIVDVEMRFASRARYPSELRYRLPMPEGASLAALEVCDAEGCVAGSADPGLGPLSAYDDAVRSRGVGRPVAHAAPTRDARGDALWVRAAPVRARSRGTSPELTVRVRYVASAPVRGARARVVIPARGRDDRVVPARVRVRSETLSRGEVDGVDAVEADVERGAWDPFEVTARVDAEGPAVESSVWVAPCGGERCARVRVVAAPQPVAARDVIVLLDASPSTSGPARGRLQPAVAALLSTLPSTSRVQIAAFAARAEPIVETPTAPTEIALTQVARALERELGTATRFEAAWGLVEPWVRRASDPLVLIVGDGGLTTGASTEAFRAARAAGAEVASLNVADRPSTAALRDALGEGLAIDAGPEADRAGRGHGMDPLRERLSTILSPVVRRHTTVRVGRRTIDLGPLRAGEERVWEGPVEGRVTVAGTRAGDPPADIALAIGDRLARAVNAEARPLRLAALHVEAAVPESCRLSGTFSSPSAVVPPDGHLVLADTRRCDTPAVPEPGATPRDAIETPEHLRASERSNLPRRALLTSLRQRLVPAARACFRDDRAGRANYQRRAVYRFTIADREVVSADVTGAIEPALRACLVRAVDDLDVPRFEGAITVSYPLYTEPRLPAPTLSLDADVADVVDAVAPRE